MLNVKIFCIFPVKVYIVAFLLDLNDPIRIIGRLKEPLLNPNENKKEGYVPNVVYSYGSQIFCEKLIIPYAMSDYATIFAAIDLNELLDELEANGYT